MNTKQFYSLFIIGLILLGICMVFVQPVKADWYDINFSYYRKITINHSMIDEKLVNFPVFVYYNFSDISSHVQFNGNDIKFVNVDNVTVYNHEIESFNNYEMYAWVNITTIYSDKDTDFLMYYGNNTCNNQENVIGTWDNNYIAVYHMYDNTTSTINDSTKNFNNGTKININQPIEDIGILKYSQNFDGDDDSISINDNDILEGFGQLTFSAWIKPNFDGSDNWYRIIDKKYDSTYSFYVNSKTQLGGIPGDLGAGIVTIGEGSGSSNWYAGEFGLTCIENIWSHVAFTWSNLTENANMFLNKTKGNSLTRTGNNVASNGQNMYIGDVSPIQTDRAFKGNIDEIRISNIVRNRSYINATYDNIINYDNFINIGNENNYNDIVYVDDNAVISWYDKIHVRTINEGINNVSVGGTIKVFDGYYYESISLLKKVNFIGNGSDTTFWINNSFCLNIFDIMYVNVSGFNFTSNITYSVIIDSFMETSTKHIIKDNFFNSKYCGIKISSSWDNIIKNNKFYGVKGIYFSFTDYYQLIYNNIFNCTSNIEIVGINSNLTFNISKTLGTNIINGPYFGGNYWNNYTGLDNNLDGIGDIAFYIGNGFYDYLPLVYLEINLCDYIINIQPIKYPIKYCVELNAFNGTFNLSINCSNNESYFYENVNNGIYCVTFNLSYNITYIVWINFSNNYCNNSTVDYINITQNYSDGIDTNSIFQDFSLSPSTFFFVYLFILLYFIFNNKTNELFIQSKIHLIFILFTFVLLLGIEAGAIASDYGVTLADFGFTPLERLLLLPFIFVFFVLLWLFELPKKGA